MPIDWTRAAELETALKASVRGEVRFDAGSRALYATDASNYRQVPTGVFVPEDADDAEAALAVCRRFDAAVLGRGGGTSLAGQCCNTAVVFDFSKRANRVLELDAGARWARVEPGLILDDLQAAAGPHGLAFGPDPATHSRCTLGGMIGNNSCGVHSLTAGRTGDNVLELEVLTYDGLRMTVGETSDEELASVARAGGRRAEIYAGLTALRDRCAGLIRSRFPVLPRRVSGYQLDELLPEKGFQVARALTGTEGSCVLLLSAKVRLIERPPHRALLVIGYADVFEACDHVPEVLESSPIGLEGLDDELVRDARRKGLHRENLELLPDGGGWLVAEFGGADPEEAESRARGCMERLSRSGRPPAARLFLKPAETAQIWEIRESGLGATAFVPGRAPTWPGWEDSAVPPERLGSYMREFRGLLTAHGYEGDLYGHFGQGCVHTRINFDLVSVEGLARWRRFLDKAADLVVAHGGSLSGEHGDGQARAALLSKMYGEELVEAFREFKRLWDPAGRMNPGKKIDAFGPTENLRLGRDYAPADPAVHFGYPESGGSFAAAALRCVGVGKCRQLDGGVMCPSFMATREEKHSTRGRARLLFEMLNGGILKGGWREPAVKEALDLCLACKGCKGECPVAVDMATYKAEFLSHYYAGLRLRPRAAYAMGQIRFWSGAAMLAPGAVNALAASAVLGPALKRLGGIDPRRRLPAFARRTFRVWFEGRPARREGGEPVIVWPDTFTDRFQPEAGRAGVEFLEEAGFAPELPPAGLCCGRPLYDFGFLSQAKELLVEILEALRPRVRAGVAMVVLEPSCASVFRDELMNFFPHDQDARRLRDQTFFLPEFLARRPSLGLRLPGRALFHGHCHQKALAGTALDRALLEGLGLELGEPEPGCCGMAGAFGFEAGERCDVSLKIGERLVGAARSAPPEALLVADGFSCRQQIEQGAGRRPMHLAQILRAAQLNSRK